MAGDDAVVARTAPVNQELAVGIQLVLISVLLPVGVVVPVGVGVGEVAL